MKIRNMKRRPSVAHVKAEFRRAMAATYQGKRGSLSFVLASGLLISANRTGFCRRLLMPAAQRAALRKQESYHAMMYKQFLKTTQKEWDEAKDLPHVKAGLPTLNLEQVLTNLRRILRLDGIAYDSL